MHVASTEEIAFYQKCLSNSRRVDGRQSNQLRNFELVLGRDIIDTCNGSSKLYLPQENLTILVGIKADVVSLVERAPGSSLVSINISSAVTKNQTVLEKEYLDKIIGEMSAITQKMLDRFVTGDKLILIEKKLAWQVYLDVYINGYISYCNFDHLSYAVRAAMNSCELPELDINLNNISNEYSFSVKDSCVVTPFASLNLPHYVVGGYSRGQIFFDLTLIEGMACDCVFLSLVSAEGAVLELKKIDGGEIKPEGLITMMNEVRRFGKALYSYALFDITDRQVV
jgi:exosome complex RNA-binding protein Rrp42 (RNase PH superfamily)